MGATTWTQRPCSPRLAAIQDTGKTLIDGNHVPVSYSGWSFSSGGSIRIRFLGGAGVRRHRAGTGSEAQAAESYRSQCWSPHVRSLVDTVVEDGRRDGVAHCSSGWANGRDGSMSSFTRPIL